MTPVLVWTAEDGRPQGLVETDRPHAWTAEEFRAEAEDLDLALDGVLDRAIAHVNALSGEASSGDAFLRAWAIGKSLNDSDVYRLDAMQGERPDRLWKALASKIRVGVRAGGKPESTWQELRPSLDRQPRREGGRLDYFEMCRWLAEQDFADAQTTFGGSVRNVWQLLERPALRPLALRAAFLAWLESLSSEKARRMTSVKIFPELMKAMRRRWPDRGPGSAKRPIHYDSKALTAEVATVLSTARKEIPDD